MSLLRNVVIFLIYINSLCYALRCTTNCSVYLWDSIAEVPESCNITTSDKQCEFRISVSYPYRSVSISLSSSSKSRRSSMYSTSVDLSDSGSINLYYSVTDQCKDKDDCAREYATNKIADALERLAIDYAAMSDELSPLLVSKLPIADADVSCFDSKERVRQCSIASKFGACQVSDVLTKRKDTTRSCEQESYLSRNAISMFEFDGYAAFSVTCNRSLCNGPKTLQAVKEIMFKYNITKTIEGRLNHGLRLSFPFTFLIYTILLLLLV